MCMHCDHALCTSPLLPRRPLWHVRTGFLAANTYFSRILYLFPCTSDTHRPTAAVSPRLAKKSGVYVSSRYVARRGTWCKHKSWRECRCGPLSCLNYPHTRAPFDAVDQVSSCRSGPRRQRRRAEMPGDAFECVSLVIFAKHAHRRAHGTYVDFRLQNSFIPALFLKLSGTTVERYSEC